MSLSLGHLGFYTRSLGQMKEIPYAGCRGNISCIIDLKIGRNVCINEVLYNLEFGSPGVIN